MLSKKTIKIGEYTLGNANPVLLVAELSANHGGSLQTALDTVEAAAEAGADAIKLQTYTADTLTIDVDLPDFRIQQGTLWDGRTLYDLYKEAHTPWEWHEALFKKAKSCGLMCFSSPFDATAVDFLEQFQPPAYKIASFEITDLPLIRYAASKQRPMIFSTGIATKEEIKLAIQACQKEGNNDIILLKCTSSYPAQMSEANLRMIPDLAHVFGTLIGLSDHTEGLVAPTVAVSLGAVLIEKHFILDKKLGGPDADFSMNPEDFANMVKAVRQAEASLGKAHFEPTESSVKGRTFARSLYVVRDVKKGDRINAENVRSIRPGFGLLPKYLPDVQGKSFNHDYPKGTPLKMEMLS